MPCKLPPDLVFRSRSPPTKSWFLIYGELKSLRKKKSLFFLFFYNGTFTEQKGFLFYFVLFLLNFLFIAIFTPRRCSLTWLGFVGGSWSKTLHSLRDDDSDVYIYCALSPRQCCRTLLSIEFSQGRECGLGLEIMMDLSFPLSHTWTF